MSTQKNRVNAIVALINSCPAFSGTILNKIKREFHQVLDLKSVANPHRRNLLKILHATRALDTTLKTFLDHHHIIYRNSSIGAFLYELRNHQIVTLGKLSESERINYQRTIVNVRNTFLHTADSYPSSESDVLKVVSEMEVLISRVTNL